MGYHQDNTSKSIASDRESLRRQVMREAALCDGCNRCLQSCHLTPERKVPMRVVLQHLPCQHPPADQLQTFVLDCSGCGQCALTCPHGLRPDLMVRWEKAKFRQMPYRKFMRARGNHLVGRLVQHLHNQTQRRKLGALAQYMDNNPSPAPLLFYFACYLFSPTSVARDTLWLADYLGLPYAVLGGMRHCCGYVHRMAGQLEAADRMYEDLGNNLLRLQPQTIVTGCRECYQGLAEINSLQQLGSRVISTETFILEHWSDLGLPPKLSGQWAWHRCCQQEHSTAHQGLRGIGAESSPGESPVAMGLETVIDLVPTPGLCCRMAAAEHNPEFDAQVREAEVKAAQSLAGQNLLVDCVSCREKLVGPGRKSGVEVTDLASLVAGILQSQSQNSDS